MIPKTSVGSRYQLNSTPPQGGVFRALKWRVAIEKVPLLVVCVNNKLLYLVFY
jgi:hypothetical protein